MGRSVVRDADEEGDAVRASCRREGGEDRVSRARTKKRRRWRRRRRRRRKTRRTRRRRRRRLSWPGRDSTVTAACAHGVSLV